MDSLIEKFAALKSSDDEEDNTKTIGQKEEASTISAIEELLGNLNIISPESKHMDQDVQQEKELGMELDPEETLGDLEENMFYNFDSVSPTDTWFNNLIQNSSQPKQEAPKIEQDTYYSFSSPLPLDFPWEEASKDGDPVVTDVDIDYQNIFEDVSRLAEVEQQLQLLFRPFTCTMDVCCRFNLYELGTVLPDARFEPSIHPAVFLKVRSPSAHVKIFADGVMVATALTATSARNALFKVVRAVQELGYKADINTFTKNVVNASFMMPFKIHLPSLILDHQNMVICNNSNRPFVTYTTGEDVGVRFAIFPTGFVLVLHSSAHSESRAAIAIILPILAKFKNGYPTPAERDGLLLGDISYKLLWEQKLEEDKDGELLYS